MTWPPEIGTPQWRHQYESFRVFEQFLRDKLSDDRQYLADPMMRADDRATLQDVENSLAIFKLEKELLTNPSPGRVAEIHAQRSEFGAAQADTFAFLQRFGKQQNQRFEQARNAYEDLESKCFKHSEDYSSITFEGKTYKLTSQQALIIKHLDAARLNGNPRVSKESIQDAIGANGSDPRDSFRRHAENKALWQMLVKVDSDGLYWLNV